VKNTRALIATLALVVGAYAPGCSSDVEGNGGGDNGGGGNGGGDNGGGNGGGDGATFCAEECSGKADCSQDPLEFDCVDGRCVADLGTSGSCSADGECRALFSGWSTDCTADDGCPGQVCIDTGGGDGKCATEPSEFLTCEQIQMEELTMSRIEGGDVTVCGNDSARCNTDGGFCFDPCTSDGDCADSNHPSCNTTSGLCNCTASSCSDFGDVCTSSGFCGCSSADACPTDTNHPGTSWVCE
jgi:hypothetical protein